MDNIYILFSKLLYSELSKVFKCLENFNYVVIKGEPLSKLAYGNFNKRKSTDIDFLIDKKDIAIVSSILNENGFFQKEISRNGKIISNMFSHQFTPFVKKTPIANLTVDVNYDLFWGEYEGERIDITEFINDSFFMDIFGNLVKTLTPEKALIQLVLHHYKEMNSLYHLATHNSINLIMFEEIYNLIINSAITPERVYCLSKKYNILPYMYYMLYYTAEALENNDLEKHISLCKAGCDPNLINNYGLSRNEIKSWKYDFKTRLNAENMYTLIESDLTIKDKNKIEINRKVFG